EDTGELGDVERRGGSRRRRSAGFADRCRSLADHVGIATGGQFLHLIGNQLGNAAIRRPERLANADRVLHHLDHGSIPVVAVAIVEQAMAPRLQVALAASRYRHDDVQRLLAAYRLTAAGTGAVKQETVTGRRDLGVSFDVFDFHRQLTALAVDIQHAGLEHRLLVTRIEGLEGDEVAQQRDQAMTQANQLVQLDQAIRRFGYGLVLFHQRQQARLGALFHQFENAPALEYLGDRHLRRLGTPGQVVAAQRDQMLPLLARQAVLLTVDRHHHTHTERIDGLLPG